jgi:hypothetical protein
MIESIKVPMYERDIAFLVEITPEEFDRFYYDNATKITDEEYRQIRRDISEKTGVGGVTWRLDSELMLVYLSNGRSDVMVPHEIFHVCNKILCAAGVNHDADAEPWAYMIGWLTNEYYRKYWDWVDKGENKYGKLE